jgi:hypothetical protein
MTDLLHCENRHICPDVLNGTPCRGPCASKTAPGNDLAARVLNLREERGIGMDEAKRIVMREQLERDVRSANSIDDLKALMLRIISAP